MDLGEGAEITGVKGGETGQDLLIERIIIIN